MEASPWEGAPGAWIRDRGEGGAGCRMRDDDGTGTEVVGVCESVDEAPGETSMVGLGRRVSDFDMSLMVSSTGM